MKERLCNKFGPNSLKDAEETRRKLEGLHGDHRGWDIYLAALDTLVEVLSKTPVRDTANNPVLQPVPVRPHLPIPPITATQADFLAYKNADANAQRAWEVLNPNDKYMNHCPTDAAIKSTVMLALGSSTFAPYFNLVQQYQKNDDHANKIWNDLHIDIESNITNNTIRTSRDPDVQMNEPPAIGDSRFEQQSPLENRSSRTLYDAYHYDGRKRTFEQPSNPQDVRAATPTSNATTPTQLYPCANCNGDHAQQNATA